MRWFLLVLWIASWTLGALVAVISESAIHEIEFLILVLIGTNCAVGFTVAGALRRIWIRLAPPTQTGATSIDQRASR